MRKILKISTALLLLVVIGIALIAVLPNKSIDEIEEIQSALIDIGYHDTLKNELIEYMNLYVETLENQNKFNKESIEGNFDRAVKRETLRDELRSKMSYYKERIEAKELSTETASEIKKLSLEIIEEIETYLLLTDDDYFNRSEVEYISETTNRLRNKVQEFNTILNKYFS